MSMIENPDDVLMDFNAPGMNLGGDFTVIPDGVYHFQIASAKIAPNSAKTGNNLELEFNVLEPDFSGCKIKVWQSMSAAAAWSMVAMLEAITQEPWITDGEVNRQLKRSDVTALPGKKCKAIVVEVPHYKNPNKTQNNVQEYLPDDGAFAGIPYQDFHTSPAPTATGGGGVYQPL